MQSASANFYAAEKADVNQISSQVYLLLGNYASASSYGTTVTASSTDGSGNYPAAGAIDGDRTELNVGAASGADNNVGLSSWKSATAPDTTPQTLKLDFGATRRINRIKLYHLSSHGLKTFKFSWSTDDSVYTDFAATSDIVSGGQTSITTAGQLDTVDFPDITCRYLLLTINHTQVAAEKAQVVEIECYRKVDITSRVIQIKVDRSRDYKLANPLASAAQITVDNSDRFFSPSHTPTAAEIVAGFINNELAPNIGMIVKTGFTYGGSQEYLTQFTGSLDSIVVRPSSRQAILSGRDGMKALINQIVSTRLKTSQDISALITYMLNLGNISTFETDIALTGVTVDQFFSNQQSIITTIRDLVQASGDAAFFFDESGKAFFRYYMAATPQQRIFTTEADFELAGYVNTNIDTTTTPGQVSRRQFLIDDFSDADITSNPTWTVRLGNAYETTIDGEKCIYLQGHNGGPLTTMVTIPWTNAFGTWQFDSRSPITYGGGAYPVWYTDFFMGTIDVTTKAYITGYQIQWENNIDTLSGNAIDRHNIKIYRWDAGVQTYIGDYFDSIESSGWLTFKVTRSQATGQFKFYYWDSFFGTWNKRAESNNDMNYTTCSVLVLKNSSSNSANLTEASSAFGNIKYSTVVESSYLTLQSTQSVYESGSLDQTSTVNSEGIFQADYIAPGGSSLAFYTATSSDNVTWDAYVSATPGSAIASATKRYIKWKAVFTCPADGGSNANLTTPIIFDVTINWSTGLGTAKYPASVSYTFRFDTALLDVEQTYTDSLGGDTSILNDVFVQAKPLILTGSDSDTQFQATVNSPPVPVSVSTPLNVTNGQTVTYQIQVNGMDTSRMSGADPAAAAITFAGGATGSWSFSYIHPTRPILKIVITHNGTITDLRVIGKSYSNSQTIAQQQSNDAASIKLYGDRASSISNPWITNDAMALSIAQRLVSNFKLPTAFVSNCMVRPTSSIQLGDRVTVVDQNTDLSSDYLVTGIEQSMASSLTNANAGTALTMLAIP